MKIMGKCFKILSGILITIILLNLLIVPIESFAEGSNNTYTEDGVTAILADDGTLTISGTGKLKKELVRKFDYENAIKNVVINEGVTSIENGTFYGCRSLTSIEIPNSVTSIGDYAFRYCERLTSIKIPSSVTSIGDYAFDQCSRLTSIEIPEGVTSIGKSAFTGCRSLTSIKIPEGVTSIGDYAFHYCSSLTSIEIPSSVTSIGDYAFYYCSSLTSIKVASDNKNFISEDGILFNKDKTKIICFPAKKEGSSYIIPSSVISIGDYAFYDCSSLTSIEIPEGVTSIGDDAFYHCSSLTSIEIPSSVTSIGKYAFYYCSSLISIKIPEGVTSIGNNAFYYCSSLTSIKIPEGVTSIENNAFFGCEKLTSIEIPEGVTSIGESAFTYCRSLTSIKIPEGVTSIGDEAFWECSSLTSIEIPSSVTSIGKRAFCGCSSLTSIIVSSGNKNFISEDGILFNKDKTKIICYPAKKEGSSYIIPSSVTSIENGTFYGCRSLTSIKIPEGVTSIGDYAFHYCRSLTSIEIPKGVTSIGDYVFGYCEKLTSIEISEGVTSIGVYAFEQCSRLTSIEIPEGVTSIGDEAFYGCSSLTSISVSNDNKNFISEDGILFNKDKTKIICYPAKKEGSSYIIPSSVTSIGKSAFYGCSKNFKIYCKSNSKAQEYAKKNNINYEIDDDAPEILGNTDGWTKNNVTLTIEDKKCGLKEVTVNGKRVDIGEDGKVIYGISENGEWTIVATDNLGNTKEEEVVVNKIDKIVPTISKVIKTPENWTIVGVTLKVEAEDKESGIKEYSFDGGTTWQTKNEKTYNKNTNGIKIQVKDNAGNIKEYGETINITNIKNMTDVIEIKNYTLENNMLKGIEPGITLENFKENVIIKDATKVKILNKENKEIGKGEKITTGSKVQINAFGETVEYKIVVTGDITEDGQADYNDMMKVNLHRLNRIKLQGEYFEAGDINKDGKVDFTDFIKINLFRLKKIQSL